MMKAEHVGIVRSVHGNLAHLQSRISAHKKQLHAVLPVGMAKAHRGNISAIMKAHHMYCMPVLFSGIAALILKSSETSLIDQYVKDTLSNLQKLMPRTPAPVVHFLAGQLPGTAQLHLRHLTLFGMICRLQESIIHKASEYQLTTSQLTNGSWIMNIRDLCLKYDLPTPLALLQSPPPKCSFKALVKAHVLDFWEQKLRSEAAKLDSLVYFKPNFMSLVHPHPIWTTCGSNSFEVNKAITQARMLSGRYLTDQLARHWTNNRAGICLLKGCTNQALGSLEHILLHCPALHATRQKMMNLCMEVASKYPPVKPVIELVLSSRDNGLKMQFLLDCSCLPPVIRLQHIFNSEPQLYLFYLSRTWCYSIHRRRMDMLGLFQYR